LHHVNVSNSKIEGKETEGRVKVRERHDTHNEDN